MHHNDRFRVIAKRGKRDLYRWQIVDAEGKVRGLSVASETYSTAAQAVGAGRQFADRVARSVPSCQPPREPLWKRLLG